MAGKKLTVVISQAQGKNPARRNLEEELAAALLMEPEINVSLVPHLYDMDGNHTGTLFLRSVPGDLVVLSWLYPRAARWTLDRQGVRGHEGTTLLKAEGEDEDDDEESSEEPPRGIGSVDVPNRKLYCLDLRAYADHRVYLEEIRRISKENAVQTYDLMQWIQGSPKPEQLQRYLLNSPNGEQGSDVRGQKPEVSNGDGSPLAVLGSLPEEESTKRRWYPVIDYSRCTNCMECIDFCLFGVYGVDALDRILVEQQDNCKKGCPACSRVCPENAIIFPGHKTPAIAGASGEVAGFKIDLSKLFGGPAASALDVAVAERDAELMKDGRDAVGMSVGIPKRQTRKGSEARDELDDLMDGLDALDL